MSTAMTGIRLLWTKLVDTLIGEETHRRHWGSAPTINSRRRLAAEQVSPDGIASWPWQAVRTARRGIDSQRPRPSEWPPRCRLGSKSGQSALATIQHP